jgi:hypothetical protein
VIQGKLLFNSTILTIGSFSLYRDILQVCHNSQQLVSYQEFQAYLPFSNVSLERYLICIVLSLRLSRGWFGYGV